MFRRNTIQEDFTLVLNSKINLNKEIHHSISTNESSSPREQVLARTSRPSMFLNKQKSQLCKKFMENGSCPYQKKCKFAHGSHELRKNCQLNSKYKTKQCGAYQTEGCCLYGNRCNFIHKPDNSLNQQICADLNFIDLKAEVRGYSKLLAFWKSQ